MKTIDLSNTIHRFEKQNLITVIGKKTNYDILKCTKCGIKGKRYGISNEIILDGRTANNKIINCDGSSKVQKIKITNCTANGRQFSNLIPGSIHDVIIPPKGYKNGDRGYWVMGVGEPVLVLFNEFEFFND